MNGGCHRYEQHKAEHEPCGNDLALNHAEEKQAQREPYSGPVTVPMLAALVLLAAAVGVIAVLVVRLRGASAGIEPSSSLATSDDGVPRRRAVDSALPDSVVRLLAVLPQITIVVDSSGRVLRSSPEAQALGIVVGDRVANTQVAAMVGEVTRTGEISVRDIDLAHPAVTRVSRDMHVRVAPLSSAVILILIEDLSESRRVDEVRRDFVANVSHELKTPVGALGILAEAVEAASDEPDEVRHFARRMRIESARLAALVNDIIDLSRLQGGNPLEHANIVSVDRVVAEAIDAARLPAEAKDIDVIRGGASDLTVFGEEQHLVTALRNLITNAINYSADHTRIAVGTRLVDGVVEVSVTDQGIGIPVHEQARIFERFYRVDQARSRVTGGTGLGLAIVKHVCVNHGGEVTVWSRRGEGSTFTLRIPAQSLAGMATSVPDREVNDQPNPSATLEVAS